MRKIPMLLLAVFFSSCGIIKPETDCTKYAQLSYDATYTLCKALQLFSQDTSQHSIGFLKAEQVSLSKKVLANSYEVYNEIGLLAAHAKSPKVQSDLIALQIEFSSKLRKAEGRQ